MVAKGTVHSPAHFGVRRQLLVWKSWKRQLLAVSILFFCVLWFSAAELDFGDEVDVLCANPATQSCVEDLVVTQKFVWSTLSRDLLVSGTFVRPTVLRIPVTGFRAQEGLLVYGYRPQALIGLALEFTSEPLREWKVKFGAKPAQRKLRGTTPGRLHGYMEEPFASLWLGDATAATMQVSVERSRGAATVAFAPLRIVRGPIAKHAWRHGWLFSYSIVVFLWVALYCLTTYGLRASLEHVMGRSGPSWWTKRTGLGRAQIMVASMLLAPPLYLMVLAFGFVIWHWMPLLGVASRLPPAINLQPFYVPLRDVLQQHWPDGVLKHAATPAHVEAYDRLFGAFANIVPPIVWALLVAGIVMLTCTLLYVRAANGRHLPSLPAVVLFLVMLTCLVAFPAWHQPIGEESQKSLAVWLGLGLFLMFLGMQWIAQRATVNTARSRWRVCRTDLAVAGLITLGYLGLHYTTIHLPLTYNTDERTYADLLSIAYGVVGLGIDSPTALLTLWWLVAIGAFVLLVNTLRKCERKRGRYVLLGLLTAAVILITVVRPVPESSDWLLFRYPPLYQFLVTTLLWIPGPSWETARLAALVAAASSGGLLYLLGREWGFSVPAALVGTFGYLASGTIYYWSTFSYNSFYMMLFLIGALLFFGRWIKTADPRDLFWLTVLGAAAYLCRITGLVLFLGAVVAIPIIMTVSQRHRTRQNAHGFLFYLLGSTSVILLWQTILVGSWFSWVGPAFQWNKLIRLFENETWQLVPWSFLHSNGWFLWGMIFFGAVCGLSSSRFRLYMVVLVCLVVADNVLQIAAGRMPRYDAYTRFMIPIMPAVGVSLMVLADLSERLLARGRTVACAGIVVAVLLTTDYRYLPQTCVMGNDRNPYVQYNGKAMGFVPEAELKKALPEGVDPRTVHFLQIYRMRLREMGQIPETAFQNEETIFEAAIAQGAGYVAFMHTEDPACRERDWSMARTFKDGGLRDIDQRIIDDPMRIARSPFFDFVFSVPVPPFEVLVFEVNQQ